MAFDEAKLSEACERWRAGEITAVGNPETGKESGENSEITVLGNDEDADFSNPLTDIEDAAQMPMFNPDDDDDDML